MKTICSKCGKLIKDGKTLDGLVSHGICETCASIYMADFEDIIGGEPT